MKQPVTMFKLNVPVIDSITKTQGYLTHAYINLDENLQYRFQPSKLIGDNKFADAYYIPAKRIENGTKIDVLVPNEIIGTFVNHTLTEYCGIVNLLVIHKNGCIHAYVVSTIEEPDGKEPKELDFYVGELTGAAITNETVLGIVERKKEKSDAFWPESPCCDSCSNKRIF